MTLREKIRSAIANQAGWDIPGLLRDVLIELDSVTALESEVNDYEDTVRRLRKTLKDIQTEAEAASRG